VRGESVGGSQWNGTRGEVASGGVGGRWPNRLSPFLRSSNTVRLPLSSGLKAFQGPRKSQKKISLTSEVET
jgi:hypothetical protein